MTQNEFKALHSGQIIYHTMYRDRWKITGNMQGSLKTGSAKWPLKHGIYDFGYLRLGNMHLYTI